MRLCDHQQAAYPLCCAHGAQIPCFPLRDSSGGLKLSICNRVCTAPPRVHGLLCLRHKPAGPDPTQRQRMWVWGKRGHTMTCSHPEWGHRHPRLAQRPWSPPECGHRYPLAGRHPLAGTDTPGGHRGHGLTPWLAQTPPAGTEAVVSPTQVLPSSPGTWGSLHSHWKLPLVFLHRADAWQGGSTSSSHSLMSAHTMGGQCPASAPLPRRPAHPQSCL